MIETATTAPLMMSDDKYFWMKGVSGKNLSGIFYTFSQSANIQMPSIIWNGL